MRNRLVFALELVLLATPTLFPTLPVALASALYGLACLILIGVLVKRKTEGIRLIYAGLFLIVLGAVVTGIGVYRIRHTPISQRSINNPSKESSEKRGGASLIGSIAGNQGIITQGQIGNNTLITEPRPWILDSKTKEELIAHIPSKEHKIVLMVLHGDQQALRDNLADQIAAFLSSQGYKNIEAPHRHFSVVGGPKQPDITIGPLEGAPNTIIIKIFASR